MAVIAKLYLICAFSLLGSQLAMASGFGTLPALRDGLEPDPAVTFFPVATRLSQFQRVTIQKNLSGNLVFFVHSKSEGNIQPLGFKGGYSPETFDHVLRALDGEMFSRVEAIDKSVLNMAENAKIAVVYLGIGLVLRSGKIGFTAKLFMTPTVPLLWGYTANYGVKTSLALVNEVLLALGQGKSLVYQKALADLALENGNGGKLTVLTKLPEFPNDSERIFGEGVRVDGLDEFSVVQGLVYRLELNRRGQLLQQSLQETR